MSELLVTQCPYCQTRFRLSQQHLAAAAGNVRCGACLKVFNASMTPHPAAAPAPRPTGAPEPSGSGLDAAESSSAAEAMPSDVPPPALPVHITPTPPRQGTLLIHDDLDFDELDLEALGLDESLVDEVNPREVPRPESPLPIPQDELNADAALPVLPAEENDAGEISPVRDMDAEFELELDPEADAALVPDADKASDPLLDLHEDFIASPVQDFGPTPYSGDQDDPTETQDAERAGDFRLTRGTGPLRPLTQDPSSAQAQGIYLRDKPEYITPKLSWHEPTPEPEDAQPRPDELAPSEFGPRLAVAKLFKSEPGPELDPEPDLGELDIPELREDPVLFDEPQTIPSRNRLTWLWGTLSLVAAGVLMVQFIAYNFTALAHDQRTRPMLDTACLLVGCQLPPRVDISLLRSSNLMVRAHPEFPNALAVDVILYNRADFAQPFPVLRMSFTDSHGREISSRRFRPEEYLSGELAGVQLMPLQTPIHVGLSMLDPGEDAVSYSLNFLSP